MKLYNELASWWQLMSPAAGYVEEAEFYSKTLNNAAARPIETVLELGSGGGNNASHMKHRYQKMVLVDVSPGMLAMSRTLNPDLEHHQGDMRTVRLGRQFDAVFVHDAVSYMTTESDVRQAIETAFVHCRPGGVVLFCPDYIREHFETSVEHGGGDDGARGMRWLSWQWQHHPDDGTYFVDYAYLLRDVDGSVRVEHDRHLEGLFPRETWLRLFREVGFEPQALPFEHSDLEPGKHEVFVGVRAGSRQRVAKLSELPQNETLQVVGFRHSEHDRMISPLHALLDHAYINSRIERRIENDLRKGGFVDVIRAAARDEESARLEELQRPQVDFLVAGERLRNRAFALGKRRRIEHDGVEPFAHPFERTQLVEHIRRPHAHIRQAVTLCVPCEQRRGLLGNVECRQLRHMRRQLQGKTTGVAEAVERSAAHVLSCGDPVFALIEKRAGLLPVAQIDAVFNAALTYHHRFRNGAIQHCHVLFEALEQTHPRIVPRDDALRRNQLAQEPSKVREQTVGPLRQRLKRDVVAVPIDHERRNQIAFAVHQAERRGVDLEPVSKRNGLFEARPPERPINRCIVACQNPQRDLRPIAVKSASQETPARTHHPHHRTRLGTAARHVGLVHPEMAVANAFLTAGSNGDR